MVYGGSLVVVDFDLKFELIIEIHEERNYSELLHLFSLFFVCFIFVVDTGASYIFREITKETKGGGRWILLEGQTNIFYIFYFEKKFEIIFNDAFWNRHKRRERCIDNERMFFCYPSGLGQQLSPSCFSGHCSI